MGSNGPGNPILWVLYALVALSVILAAIGLALRRRGSLASRGAALGWAILTVLPLFGAGFAFMTTHAVEQAQGVTRSGVDKPPNRPAP